MKRFIISFLFCLAACPVFAQFSVHAKYSELTESGLGVGYDFDKHFWTNLTFVRNTVDYVSEMWFEDALDWISNRVGLNLSANYNFVTKKQYDAYVGINMELSTETPRGPFTALLGIRIRPLENLKNVSFQMEIQTITDNWHSFANFGLHYQF